METNQTFVSESVTKAAEQALHASSAQLAKIREMGHELSERGNEYIHQAEQIIRRRPLTSVAVAASVTGIAAFVAARMTAHHEKPKGTRLQ